MPLFIYSDGLHSFLSSQVFLYHFLLLKTSRSIYCSFFFSFCFSVSHLYSTYIVEGFFAAHKILGCHCVFVLFCIKNVKMLFYCLLVTVLWWEVYSISTVVPLYITYPFSLTSAFFFIFGFHELSYFISRHTFLKTNSDWNFVSFLILLIHIFTKFGNSAHISSKQIFWLFPTLLENGFLIRARGKSSWVYW